MQQTVQSQYYYLRLLLNVQRIQAPHSLWFTSKSNNKTRKHQIHQLKETFLLFELIKTDEQLSNQVKFLKEANHTLKRVLMKTKNAKRISKYYK